MDPTAGVEPTTANRDRLQREIGSASVPPGVLAYVDDVPAGWTRIMPRDAVPLVGRNRALKRILRDEPGVWWITCFAVHRRHRGIGVASALIHAAVALARHHGAIAIEGHPVDLHALKGDRVSASALFTGTAATFLGAGFHEIGRTYPSRPVMRLDL
jgi:GNAT superfamily N-acetyltransferase